MTPKHSNSLGVVRHAGLIVIDAFFPWTMNLEPRKDTIVLDEPPRKLTGEEIEAQMNLQVSDSKAFNKQHNWTHITGLWQLPYFKKLLLPHNIDVMHNEKNMGEAIWNTCFDIADKTKDNVKARQDLELICNHPNMHLVLKPNGQF